MNNRHLNLACNMALKSKSRTRLGAVVTKRKRVISAGVNNMRKTHPLVQQHSPGDDFIRGTHAEIHACIGVSAKDLDGAELYTVRLLRNGQKALAKPCKICQSYLRSVGVVGVWFTTDANTVEYLEL